MATLVLLHQLLQSMLSEYPAICTKTMSFLTRGFFPSVLSKAETSAIPKEIVEAHLNLSAKRKLNRILRSHVNRHEAVKVDDVV